MRLLKVWVHGLAVSGCLLGACAEDESHGNDSDENDESEESDPVVALGTYHLTPENRELQFELREDGTFALYALEWDLQLFSGGEWFNEDGETVLRSDDPPADGISNPRCPQGLSLIHI